MQILLLKNTKRKFKNLCISSIAKWKGQKINSMNSQIKQYKLPNLNNKEKIDV